MKIFFSKRYKNIIKCYIMFEFFGVMNDFLVSICTIFWMGSYRILLFVALFYANQIRVFVWDECSFIKKIIHEADLTKLV